MCVDNFSGLSQLDLKTMRFGVFDVKISLDGQLDLQPGISGEWGDKACTESGTTKYLCEKK